LIALALPFCHLGDLGKRFFGGAGLFSGEIFWWGLFVLILVYVAAIERLPFLSIGFRRPRVMDVVWAVVFAVAAVLGIGVIFTVILPALHLSVVQKLSGIYMAPLWFRILLVTRAAFVEETAFRGYGFERITELTGSKWLAALVTLALFTLAHYSGGGWGQVIIAAWGGLVLTVLYVWRRNLWANIICHWLTDGAGFLLSSMGPHHH
jgi:membrane protease YdiL (CAAX protease family)